MLTKFHLSPKYLKDKGLKAVYKTNKPTNKQLIQNVATKYVIYPIDVKRNFPRSFELSYAALDILVYPDNYCLRFFSGHKRTINNTQKVPPSTPTS